VGVLRRLLPALCAAALACVRTLNYPDAAGPRYAEPGRQPACAGEVLRVVTFNVRYGIHVNRAISLLSTDDSLRGADVVLLQEMDEAGTKAVADSLGMAYVYYPASWNAGTRRDFGNAVLSRWPIEADRKIVLPHHARIGGSQRAAVAVTLRVRQTRVRVYNVHLATFSANGPAARREQLETVLADADSFPRVILAGDFNSETVPEVALGRNFAWPTRALPRTEAFWTMDHILLRGLELADPTGLGVVRDQQGASDHRPVWAVVAVPRAAAGPDR